MAYEDFSNYEEMSEDWDFCIESEVEYFLPATEWIPDAEDI